MARTISVKVKHDGKEITFTFRAIRMFEETGFGAKFAEVADLEGVAKADAIFAFSRDAIIAWSVKPITIDGKPADKKGDIKESVTKLFESMDIADAERIANAVIFDFQRQSQPEIVF